MSAQAFPEIGPDAFEEPPQMAAGRPAGLTIIAVLAWIFGGLNLLCTPFNMLTLFLQPGGGFGGAPNPMAEVFAQLPWFRGYGVAMAVLGFLASGVLVAGGVGLFRLQRWGWHLLNGYAVFSILHSLVALGVNYAYVLPVMQASAASSKGGPSLAGTMGSVACCGLLGLIFPVAILIVINTGAGAAAKPPKADPFGGLGPAQE